MSVAKITFGVIVILIVLILIFLFYTGAFSKVVIREKDKGPYVLAYKEHIGAYKGTQAVQNEVYYELLNTHEIETYKGFGLYYDDPKITPEKDLKSIAGCILEEKDYDKIDMLKSKNINVMRLDKQKSIVVDFPFKNPISTIAGIIRVHPKIKEYAGSKGLTKISIMEIYDVPAKTITYLVLDK